MKKILKKRLYKDLLRNTIKFPSINRNYIYENIRNEWKFNKNLKKKTEIKKQIKEAKAGLEYLMAYNLENLQNSGNISISLSGQAQHSPIIKSVQSQFKFKKKVTAEKNKKSSILWRNPNRKKF